MIGFSKIEDRVAPRLDDLVAFGADVLFLNKSPRRFRSWLEVKAASMILLTSAHD